jgi:photosystem II stability/assembly factor-like uncharacterized protein
VTARGARGRRRIVRTAAALLAAAVPAGAQGPAPAPAAPAYTADTFGGLTARAIGPATMSGRIAAIEAVPGSPLAIWVGSASGGVWKSVDGGTTFKPVFDRHTQSIGALAIDPADPKTVWVGTGESCARNSVSIGDGVYRTTDGGDGWTHLGLAASERIAAIRIDPERRDTVYVCATGPLWGPGEERGVFRTTDAGKSWKKVLYVDETTGCSDLAIDPQEPSILYAGMWSFRREPDFFRSGGPGSALYKSTDGGETWRRLERGLPAGEKGRIAVAVAPSRPNRVYALVEAKETALYRSDDLGESFEKVNSSFNVQVRPFYFSHLAVDPTDHDRVYKPGLVLTVSTDGGRSFTSPFTGGFGGAVHSDHHALWIDPTAPQRLLLGTDGGLYLSNNRGGAWQFARNLPLSQLYHVAVDGQDPYRIYGGLQDNSSWVAPSESWGGIENEDWTSLSGGDGFWTFADPDDPRFVYTEIQGGRATRVDLATGESKDIQPQPGAGERPLRFNWNTPFVTSPGDPSTLYLGAQYLFRSRDRGDSWERISPDLTSDDPKRQRQKQSGGLSIDNSTAENNATIYTISESPRDPRVIWAGTDDGFVQLTRDGGATWTDVAPAIAGFPAGGWVARVVASRHDAATAYVAVDDHRRGDFAPYLWRTRDYGATWESLVAPEIEGWVWVVAEDTEREDLLFLGTEWGLWISIDGGRRWARFEGGLPKRVAVHDLAIQPREGDLVIGTHGRGVYVLDDLEPLRALTAATLAEDVAFLPSRPAELKLRAAIGSWFSGNDEFVGPNPPEEASIVYYLRKRHLIGDFKVEIRDAAGELVATLPASKRVGLNRVAWPTRIKPPKVPPASSILFGSFEGPRLPEGEYRVTLVKGAATYEGSVRLVADPRNPHPAEDRAAKQTTERRIYDDLERLAWIGDSLVALRDAARERGKRAGAGLARRLAALADEAEALRTSFVATGDGYISGDEKLREHLGTLYGNVLGYEGRPSRSQLDRLAALEVELGAVEQRFGVLAGARLAAANAELGRSRLDAIELADFAAWKAKDAAPGAPGAAAGPKQVGRLLAAFPELPALPARLLLAF